MAPVSKAPVSATPITVTANNEGQNHFSVTVQKDGQSKKIPLPEVVNSPDKAKAAAAYLTQQLNQATLPPTHGQNYQGYA